MKKFLKLSWLLMIISIMITSCDKDDEIVIDEDWKKANGEAFTVRGFSSDFKKLNSQSGDGYILYRVIKEGTDTTKIYFTSTIKANYKGCLIADKNGDIIEDVDSVLEKGVQFDNKMFEDGYDPVEFNISPNGNNSGVIDGWQTALQHMHVGDRWEIWIPYQLGYGIGGSSQGSVKIPPYSTLVFDMEVVEITKQ